MGSAYRRDGYVVVPNAVPLAVINAAREVSRSLYEARATSVAAFRAEARLLAKRVQIWEMFFASGIKRAARDSGISSPIMQTAPVIHAMGFDESYEGVRPHQDYPALQSSLNAITVWIPLHDVTEENYPVEV